MKIGLSSCGKGMDEELFRAYAEAGIDAMEVSVAREEILEGVDPSALPRFAKEYGVELWSYHLPFSKFDISSLTEDHRLARVERLSWHIRLAAEMGIKRYVVHPSSEPIEDGIRGARMEQSKKSLAALARVAKEVDGVLCVENLPRTCLGKNSDEILELLTADPSLRVCFDTNHLLSEDPVEFIRAVGDRLVTTHVSDYDFVDERHWLPGEGDMDWQALYGALCQVGYQGAWLYELGFGNTKRITRERDLTCEDFVRNAREIFDGKPLAVIAHEKIYPSK